MAILDGLATGGTLARWPQIHVARAALLADAGRTEDAVRAYREALALKPAARGAELPQRPDRRPRRSVGGSGNLISNCVERRPAFAPAFADRTMLATPP